MIKGKAEDSFGLDSAIISSIDWDVALKRVIHDLRSDFIWAPHIGFIYSHAGAKLLEQLKASLAAGEFHPV